MMTMIPPLPPQVAGAGDALLNLLTLLSDKAAAEARIKLLRDHEAAARQAIEEANKQIAEVGEATRTLETQRQADAAQMERREQAWRAEEKRRLAEIDAWDKQARAALEKAEKDRSAAAKLKADLEQRLAKMAQLAA
jgi:hypothetical protein